MDLIYYTLFNLITKLILSCLLYYQQVINEDGTKEEVYICKKNDGVLLLGMKLIIHTHKKRTTLDQEQRVTLIPTYLVLVEVQQEDQDIQLEFTRSLQLMKCYHPLLIFDKDAEKVVNYKVKCSWGEGLPLITGKFGLKDDF